MIPVGSFYNWKRRNKFI
uniref:Uncharacterized protein n=1 Tax=Rhizophora mucronata TaxID=61149 RepID=A0A2P2PPX8_RHIMU